MSVKALRQIQLGKETTAGTATVATVQWAGNGVLKDDRTITPLEYDDGFLPEQSLNYIPNAGATLEMEDTPATFEHLPYILAASVEATITGAADAGTGATGLIYQYDMPTSAAQTPKTFTVEMGDDQRSDEMEYSYVEKFTLTGASDEAVMVAATWKGRQATDCAFTDVAAPTGLEPILFNKAQLYIDATGGTIGSANKTSTLLGYTLDVDMGHRQIKSADGELYFSAIKQTGLAVTGSLLLEHNATGEAELNFARAGTRRLLQLKHTGSALTTAGTAYTYKQLIINLAIEYTDVPALSDQDGNDTIELPFRMVYSVADALAGQITVVNQVAAL